MCASERGTATTRSERPPRQPDLERLQQPPFEIGVTLLPGDQVRHHRAHSRALLQRAHQDVDESRTEETGLETSRAAKLASRFRCDARRIAGREAVAQ